MNFEVNFKMRTETAKSHESHLAAANESGRGRPRNLPGHTFDPWNQRINTYTFRTDKPGMLNQKRKAPAHEDLERKLR